MNSGMILETKDLTIRFGGLTAINKVSTQIPEGKIVSIIGPNGAGKTTLFNLITGALAPTEGEILFEGRSLVGKTTEQIARIGLSRTFQNIRVCTRMSVLDNVMISIQRVPSYNIFAALLRLPNVRRADKLAREQAMEYLRLLGIERYASAAAGSLPYGAQRRLEIARAIATKPKLLLLDEPAAGMNNEECSELVDLIRSIHKSQKLTIMLIEHHMDVVMNLSDEIYVINLGSVLRHGLPEAIQSDPEVIRAYLGERRRRD